MKLVYTTALSMLLSLFSGCSAFKAIKYAKRGSVRQTVFKTEVPFEMRFGLIVVKVYIQGQEHSFILDTGAPNVISKELAQQLGVKAAGSGKGGDSQGNSARLEFTGIDSIGIGGLQFLNTGAAIADLRQSSEIACFDVDGLLGANLMRKAVWEIDYERRVVTITNDRSSLTVPPDAKSLKFHATPLGTPLINIRMNSEIDYNVVVDLGSNADFYSSGETLKRLKKKGLHTDTYSYGTDATGLYGRGKEDTTWHALISDLELGGQKLSNQVVSFSKKGVKTVGTNFFKNYRLIFDWSRDELTMIQVRPYDNTREKAFSFAFALKDHRVFVSSVYSTGKANMDGPQLGDQVLEIDGKDYRSCGTENWCSLLRERRENSRPKVSLLVKRGDQELNFSVEKEALFLKTLN